MNYDETISMRQVILDTETTGLDPNDGHRVIEIGCIEVIDREVTDRHYHQYIQPDRNVEQEAVDIHGITNDFLLDKPVFLEIMPEFLAFVDGAQLVIHNAPFDMGFLNAELKWAGYAKSLNDHCTVLDTLVMAKNLYPGQRNSLDALCKRLGINNSHRTLHGALLDSQILADVYLLMTGGQTDLILSDDSKDTMTVGLGINTQFDQIQTTAVVRVNEEEMSPRYIYVGHPRRSYKAKLFIIKNVPSELIMLSNLNVHSQHSTLILIFVFGQIHLGNTAMLTVHNGENSYEWMFSAYPNARKIIKLNRA